MSPAPGTGATPPIAPGRSASRRGSANRSSANPDGREPVVEDVAFDDDRIHPDGAPSRADKETQPRRVVFAYRVPVHVEVEDGLVSRVTVIDETPVADPTVVEGDAGYLAAADDGQAWPSWAFGY